MPIYAFVCASCGPFELSRGADAAAAPAHCPTCREAARRVFTPPGVRRLEAPLRRIRDAEERSAHEPAVVHEKVGRPMPGRRHGAAPPWVIGHRH